MPYGKEQTLASIRVQVGSILWTFLKKKKKEISNLNDSSAPLSKPSILPTPPGSDSPVDFDPLFLDIRLSCTEDLCHIYHPPSALAQSLLFKPSQPHCAGTIPLSEPVNRVLIVLLEERGRFYMQQKEIKMN